VSCGGDGKIVVYEESRDLSGEKEDGQTSAWKIVAEMEGAHGVYEVNCVSWSTRYDKDKRGDSDEIIISAGDDGEVNFWVLVE
jgi:hypothetical protein